MQGYALQELPGGALLPPDPPARVLVVDDDKELRDMMGDMLTFAGYDVVTEGSTEQLLDLIGVWQPEVVIMDIMMYPTDGLVMLRQIMEQYPKQKVLIVTAYMPDKVLTDEKEYDGTRESFMRLGAWDFLPKPFDMTDLLTLVALALDETES